MNKYVDVSDGWSHAFQVDGNPVDGSSNVPFVKSATDVAQLGLAVMKDDGVAMHLDTDYAPITLANDSGDLAVSWNVLVDFNKGWYTQLPVGRISSNSTITVVMSPHGSGFDLVGWAIDFVVPSEIFGDATSFEVVHSASYDNWYAMYYVYGLYSPTVDDKDCELSASLEMSSWGQALLQTSGHKNYYANDGLARQIISGAVYAARKGTADAACGYSVEDRFYVYE